MRRPWHWPFGRGHDETRPGSQRLTLELHFDEKRFYRWFSDHVHGIACHRLIELGVGFPQGTTFDYRIPEYCDQYRLVASLRGSVGRRPARA